MTLLRFGIPRTCARFRHLTLAVSAQVIMQVGFGDLARAEDRPSSPEVGVSACRPTAGLAAFGNGPRATPAMRKGVEFARVATFHAKAGDYEHAFALFDRAISLNPENPSFYL